MPFRHTRDRREHDEHHGQHRRVQVATQDLRDEAEALRPRRLASRTRIVRNPITSGNTIARTTHRKADPELIDELGPGDRRQQERADIRNEDTDQCGDPGDRAERDEREERLLASAGTRPNSSLLAQPSTIVMILPANRPSAANNPPMIAMAGRWPVRRHSPARAARRSALAISCQAGGSPTLRGAERRSRLPPNGAAVQGGRHRMGGGNAMSIEGFLLGAIAVAVGAGFAFYGFKFFLILLPLWAFVAGFAAGAQAMSRPLRRGIPRNDHGLGHRLHHRRRLRGASPTSATGPPSSCSAGSSATSSASASWRCSP